MVEKFTIMQKKILELANEVEENIYIKEDGSLSDGFEIVSYPMTLYYHKNNMNWQEIMKKRFVWDITVINQVQQDYISMSIEIVLENMQRNKKMLFQEYYIL